MNPYKDILKNNLPKLFSLYNQDSCSQTHGFGDRLHWGWKISDFPNGTMQGGVHALSIAVKLGLIENVPFVLKMIDSAIKAIPKIRAANGSLVEAYPNEHSFCVTALVVFDVLSAVRHLEAQINAKQKKEYLNIVRPLIRFISDNDEKHAIISNHLATGVAAIELWNKLTGETSQRGKELLTIIYQHQSKEGWYREYEGADPGYQTLCTYYLFGVYEVTADEELLDSLKKSVSFLKYFAHPDGTIGGLYGSRNTEVYYPGGLIALATCSDDFTLVARSLHKGVLQGNHVFPQNIDTGNFIPLLNAYAVAALHYEKNRTKVESIYKKAFFTDSFDVNFKEAGIYIRSTARYYAIINYKKGGTIKVFDKDTALIDMEDGGLFGRLSNGKGFTTQQYDNSIQFNDFTIRSKFYTINETYPTAFSTIILRFLGLTFFRSVALGNLFKKYIVKLLMTGKNTIDGLAVRRFEFLNDRIIVREEIQAPKKSEQIGHIGKCKAIHMASSGYYLKQDQQIPERSKIVVFKQLSDF